MACNLISIPPEIIEIILSYPIISTKDILNVRLTCRYLNDIIGRPSLWKKKLFHMWPFMADHYRDREIEDWCGQCKHIMKTQQFCKDSIMVMSPMFRWRRMAISHCDLEHFLIAANENEGLAYHYLMNYLKMIFETDVFLPESTPGTGLLTLTNQYYAKIVYDYIFQQHYLKNLWSRLMYRETSFVPDLVAKFVIQWLYPRKEENAAKFMDYIAYLVQKVESKLLQDHPLFRIDDMERENWSENLLEDNQLGGMACRQIMSIISNLIFEVESFHKSSQIIGELGITEMVNYQNSYKYLTFVIYESVARRCGIRCDITGTGNHMFMYWRENWSEGSIKYIVDIISGKMKLSTGRCPFAPANSSPSPDSDKEYSASLLLTNLAPEVTNIIHVFDQIIVTYTLELLYTLLPEEVDNLKFISHMYVLQKKDVRSIIDHIMRKLEENDLGPRNREELLYFLDNAVKEQEENSKGKMIINPIKGRMPNVKFAIGMVCLHKAYGYKCMLTGWDYQCKASQEWQRSMGVSRLSGGYHQPFYHALAEDGSQRYVAQENLEFMRISYRLKLVEDKISIDFSHFNGNQYIPNNEKQQEYPNDLSHSTFYQSRMLNSEML